MSDQGIVDQELAQPCSPIKTTTGIIARRYLTDTSLAELDATRDSDTTPGTGITTGTRATPGITPESPPLDGTLSLCTRSAGDRRLADGVVPRFSEWDYYRARPRWFGAALSWRLGDSCQVEASNGTR